MDEDLGFDMLAAALRADASDLDTFVEVLGDKLEAALPGKVRVERRGGFLSRQKRTERVRVELGGNRYELLANAGRVEPRRATAVRGIVLKTEEMPLDQWIDDLSRDLAAEAARSRNSRQAIERLLGI